MSDDDILTIDLNDLRVHEIETIEEVIGTSIDEAFGAGAPRGKALRALGYVIKRRDNPDFTLEDAGNLRLSLVDPPTTAVD